MRPTIHPSQVEFTILLTYRTWQLNLDPDAVIRGQGMDPVAVRARSQRIVTAAERAIELASPLLEPVVMTRTRSITGRESARLLLDDGGELLCSPELVELLAPATSLIVVAATVGQPIDTRAIELFADDPMLALAVHGVGSAAVEDLAMQACCLLQRESDGPSLTLPCWPGFCAWPIREAQAQIFTALSPKGEAGGVIELNAARLLRPAKSLSFLIGLAAEPSAGEEVCTRCGLAPVCGYPRSA